MKTIKKVLLSSVSVLGISFIIWTVLMLNPQLSYANHTQFSQVTIHHNQELTTGTEEVIANAIEIIKKADIYNKDLNIRFCLNDDKYYPKFYPFAAGTAYAFFNKTVMFGAEPDFENNVAEFKWEVNNYELRKYNLTILLAHEFMHNMQSSYDTKYFITSTLGNINWKFEGHAEYIAREYQNDGQLKDRIELYQSEEIKDHVGVPVIKLDDGTIQNLAYLKYTLVIQYLVENKNLNFSQVCKLETSLDDLYSEMLEWSKND